MSKTKVYNANFNVDAATLFEATLSTVQILGYKGEANRAASQLIVKTGMSLRSFSQKVSIDVTAVSESAAALQVSIHYRAGQLIDWGASKKRAEDIIKTVARVLQQGQPQPQGQLQQPKILISAVEVGGGDITPDDDVVCPWCGSEEWSMRSGLMIFLLGLAVFSCGLWVTFFGLLLIIVLIGIPIFMAGLGMLATGVGMMAVGPFTGTAYQCGQCKKTWKPSAVVKDG